MADREYVNHGDAIADTGDGYTVERGYRLACLWCSWETFRPTKAAAVADYRLHGQSILSAEYAAAAPRALAAQGGESRE